MSARSEKKAVPKTRRSWRRRAAFAFLLGILILGVLEAASVGLFYVMDGQWFSYAKLDDERAKAAAPAAATIATPAKRTDPGDDATKRAGIATATWHLAVHPYLGYVFHPHRMTHGVEIEDQREPVNSYGFVDANEPVQRRGPDRVIVGITGGSVGMWFGALGAPVLAQELAKHEPFRGKEIVFVRLALGGHKQPQQLMALNYLLSLGGELDLLINIDGFNEVALPGFDNVPRNTHPFFPRRWGALVDRVPDKEFLKRLGKVAHLRETRGHWAERMSGWIASRSVLAQLVWRLRDRMMQGSVAGAERTLQEYRPPTRPYEATGPRFDARDLDEQNARLWRRCSVQLDRLCRANGIRYYHFLQPNQYIAGTKPLMPPRERAMALTPDHPYGTRAARAYPKLLAEADRIRSAGVRFFDLTRVFVETKQQVYSDNCCHYNRLGNAILAGHVAQAIRDSYAIATGKIVALWFDPDTKTIRHPLEDNGLRLLGRFEDGSIRDVTARWTGTTYATSDPAIMTVAPDGRIDVARVGKVRVTAKNGGREATIVVDTKWDPVIRYGAGTAGTQGVVPELTTNDKPPRHGVGFALSVSRARSGTKGVLIVDNSPNCRSIEPGTRRQPIPGDAIQIVVDGSGRKSLPVPIPNDKNLVGRVSYWQAFFRDDAAPLGWSVSNGLLLTVQ